MKHRLVVAFALGMLAGIVLWPNGSDSPDAVQHSGKHPKVSTTNGRETSAGPKQDSYPPLATPAPRDRGQRPQYGMRPTVPAYGVNDWEQWSGDYSYGLPSGPHRNGGMEFLNASAPGAVLSHAPSYKNPGYSSIQERTGYKFRPLNANSDSASGRRYTGGYQTSPHPWDGTTALRWNESPAYGQRQPRRRYVPTIENQQPYLQHPLGSLYSAR